MPESGSPPPSLTWTTGWTAGSKTSPSSAEVGGLVVSRIVLPAAAETVIAEDIAGNEAGRREPQRETSGWPADREDP